MENDIFWSEIGSAFEEPGGTPPTKKSPSTPRARTKRVWDNRNTRRGKGVIFFSRLPSIAKRTRKDNAHQTGWWKLRDTGPVCHRCGTIETRGGERGSFFSVACLRSPNEREKITPIRPVGGNSVTQAQYASCQYFCP